VAFNILSLIVHTIAGVLATIFLLRFWIQAVRVRPPTSIAPFIFQLSDWLVKPLRRVLPGFGGYDWACLAGAFLIALLTVAFDLWLLSSFSVEFLLLLSIARLLKWILYGFMFLIIIEVIFSWVNPHAPLAPFIRALTDPLMRPLRRIIPSIGNLDLSPLAALLLIQIGLIVVNEMLRGFA
jgi:YggT family protein